MLYLKEATFEKKSRMLCLMSLNDVLWNVNLKSVKSLKIETLGIPAAFSLHYRK